MLEQHDEIEETCIHHWMIDSPNGPISTGTCKLCGVESEFRNSVPISGWERESVELRHAPVVKVPMVDGDS